MSRRAKEGKLAMASIFSSLHMPFIVTDSEQLRLSSPAMPVFYWKAICKFGPGRPLQPPGR